MGKKLITANTEFIRHESFKDKDDKGNEIIISAIFQPYVCSVYAAITINGRLSQTGMSWNNMIKMTKNREQNLKKEGKTDIIVSIQKVGDYLTQSNIDIINS